MVFSFYINIFKVISKNSTNKSSRFFNYLKLFSIIFFNRRACFSWKCKKPYFTLKLYIKVPPPLPFPLCVAGLLIFNKLLTLTSNYSYDDSHGSTAENLFFSEIHRSNTTKENYLNQVSLNISKHLKC